jgi:vacuolar iron transporter family protein
MPGAESHYVNRAGWLRAAVLGANDGIISTASLIVGVAAAAGSRGEILTAAIAGWAAGAMSMAAGEYVSVSSQADSEAADLMREQRALAEQPSEEKAELAPHLRGAGRAAEAREESRQVADGQGRARRPCARRAWP